MHITKINLSKHI